MATTIGQHPITTFTSPTNGTSPIDADEVRDNDNAVRTAYNAHDEDTGIHVQSSTLGARPAAGTQGRKWISVDSVSAPTQVQLNYDGGSAWYALNYFPGAVTVAAGGIAVTGNSTITGTLGGLTGLTVASGGAAITGNSTITGVTTVTAASSEVDIFLTRTGTSALAVYLYNAGIGMGLYDQTNARTVFNYDPTVNSFTVAGTTTLSNAVTVSTGGIAVTGNSTITGTLGGLTGLTVASGGASLGGGATITGSAIVTADLTVDTSTLKVDSANNRVGIGTATPAVPLDVAGGSTTNALVVTTTGAIQQSIRYDGSNRLDISVSSGGAVTYEAVGASAAHTFNDPVRVNAAGGLALAVSSTTQLLVMPNDSGSSAAGKAMEYRTDGTGADLRAHTFLVNNGNFAGEFASSTTADDTFLLVFDYTGAQMKRVTRGAADSGGTGFRLLRIAN